MFFAKASKKRDEKFPKQSSLCLFQAKTAATTADFPQDIRKFNAPSRVTQRVREGNITY